MINVRFAGLVCVFFFFWLYHLRFKHAQHGPNTNFANITALGDGGIKERYYFERDCKQEVITSIMMRYMLYIFSSLAKALPPRDWKGKG